MPLLSEKTVLAAAIEATVGTAETLDATDAAMNIMDAEINADFGVDQRMKQGSFGSIGAITQARTGTCRFRVNLTGDGAGAAPTWADTFLPACGLVKSGVGPYVFTPTTEPPGTNVKTLTIGGYIDGVRHLLHGCAGNARFVFPSGQMSYVEFEFRGVWNAPTDVALLSPTYPADLPMRAASATFTIGSWSPCFNSMTIDLGNTIAPRPCSTTAAGVHSFLITSRLSTCEIDPEASLVATNNHYTDWVTPTSQTFSYDLEDASDKITLSASGTNFQITNVQAGNREGVLTDTITAQFNDDSLRIQFETP